MQIGERISLARKDKHLSQAQLAKLLGADQALVSRWETNRHDPTMEYIRKLATVLGKDMTDFIEPQGGKREVSHRIQDLIAGTISDANSKKVLVLKGIPETLPLIKEDDIEGTILLPRYMFKDQGDYTVHMPDDSMEPRFRHRGLAIIQAASEPIDGAVQLVKVENRFKIRKVVKIKEGVYQLVALNRAYKTAKVEQDELKVLGTVVGEWSRVGLNEEE